MKSALVSTLVAVFAATATADAGVSISVGHPGFYGRIDIGDFPKPRLIFPEPVIIERVVVPRPPIYLHVPPGHAKNWAKHCHKYDACGRRVYFVEEMWYRDVYVPRYQERQGGGKPSGHPGKGKGRGKN